MSRSSISLPRRQRGSMLIISLFVIIVLALLGATMVRMISSSSQATIVELSGLRAITAAQSGVQVLLAQSFPLNSPINACSTTITSPASFSNVEGFRNCGYTASCSTVPVTKQGEVHNYYRFTSIGQCAVGDIIVSRQVSLDAMQVQP
ncbi:pilus assembly PilX family protein [Alteromonas oceanisediminis]|uniref:pilus assembly PilX family protein n=1 Tax=Alteromonas oceanisediminis TaxID=2836180 RepID=UPI001BDA79BD|nr:type II secretory pathway protein [Alteromonas oceanisediminis]MBT0586879.1 type II secretory pathway protein [Alteromonas oceanisediminis]